MKITFTTHIAHVYIDDLIKFCCFKSFVIHHNSSRDKTVIGINTIHVNQIIIAGAIFQRQNTPTKSQNFLMTMILNGDSAINEL